jgi:hypothetical protein
MKLSAINENDLIAVYYGFDPTLTNPPLGYCGLTTTSFSLNDGQPLPSFFSLTSTSLVV